MSIRKKLLKTYLPIFLLCILVLVAISTDITFRYDESFTMALIKHGVIQIIHLDSFDVHPPLYYLILKIFLDITTFWTSSIFIKIIFARIFSFIIFLISFFVLIRFIKQLGLSNNDFIQLLLLIAIPSVFLFSTLIRMYALAGMFLILELYSIFKLDDTNKNRYLILATIFAILAAYTHYFAAVSAGLIILVSAMQTLLKGHGHKFFNYIISGCVLAITYIPWILYSLPKSMEASKGTLHYNFKVLCKIIIEAIFGMTGLNDSSINSFNIAIKIVLSIIFMLLNMYILYWSFNNLNHTFNKYLIKILLVFVLTALIITLAAMVGFENSPRFIYPIYLILMFFDVNIFITFCKNKNIKKYRSIIFILMFLILIISLGSSAYYSMINYHQSMNIYKQVNSWRKSVKVYIPYKSWATSPYKTQPLIDHKSVFYMSDHATYLYYMNKEMLTNRVNLSITNEKKVGRKIFPNIKIDNK